MADHAVGREKLASRMREQAGWCGRLGSPMYAHLLEHLALDVLAGGPSCAVLDGHEEDPFASALALRLMGAVHRLVLEGRAPGLAAHYPSAGGDAGCGEPWPAFSAVLSEQRDVLRGLVEQPVQTNEVGRSAALLGGFLTTARETGLPLALVELGASAGLNLRWDLFRYEANGRSWGDPASPVRLACDFTGPLPPLDVPVHVASRDGCDARPIDPMTDDGALTLQSYLWPDQTERLALLRAAIDLVRLVPARVEAADAAAWIGPRLAARASGVATIVYHSIFWQYMTSGGRAAVQHEILAAGADTTGEAPLAWLRLEPVGREGPYEIKMTSWPGGRERRLGEGSPHGRKVRWFESEGGRDAE
jgi:hypothetical protein